MFDHITEYQFAFALDYFGVGFDKCTREELGVTSLVVDINKRQEEGDWGDSSQNTGLG